MPAQIERIEPAFWWVGMKSDKLQLLVHGPRIADAAPRIADAFAGSVRIESVSRVANPNYLFIDLRIAPTRRRAASTSCSATATSASTRRSSCAPARRARRSAAASIRPT